jgi:hypothetical protein
VASYNMCSAEPSSPLSGDAHVHCCNIANVSTFRMAVLSLVNNNVKIAITLPYR